MQVYSSRAFSNRSTQRQRSRRLLGHRPAQYLSDPPAYGEARHTGAAETLDALGRMGWKGYAGTFDDFDLPTPLAEDVQRSGKKHVVNGNS